MPNYDSLQHIFLIAMPQLTDHFFSQSVIYLWEYNEHGAEGVIINKPVKSRLGDLFRHLEIPIQNQKRVDAHPILMGGPVASDRGFLVQRKRDLNPDTGKIDLRITIRSSKEDLLPLADGEGLNDTLVTVGQARWEAGQLDEELKNNSWLVAPFNENILFSALEGESLGESSYGLGTAAYSWHGAAASVGVNLNRLSLEAGHA